MMNLKQYLLIIPFFLLISTSSLYAQLHSFGWAGSTSGIGLQRAKDITVDTDGYVYLIGDFSSICDLDLGPGTSEFMSAGGLDMFIQKLDPNGNLIWIKQIGGVSSEAVSFIELDNNGNVFVTGHFQGSVDFISGIGSYQLTSVGNHDIFVLKLSSDGLFQWVKQFGGVELDRVTDFNINNDGDLCVIGNFKQTVDFDPGAGVMNLTSSSWADLFILILDNNGDLIWVKQMGAAGQFVLNSHIATDSDKNIFISGRFGGVIDFDLGPDVYSLSTPSPGYENIFVQKLDSIGNLIWVKEIKGGGDDICRDIEVDGSGNIYIAGHFYDSLDVDPGIGEEYLITHGGKDVFIQKLNENGDLIWANHYGGSVHDDCEAMEIDINGDIYITGEFRDTANFGIDTLDLVSYGHTDFFIQTLDSNGETYWTYTFGGTGYEAGVSLVVDSLMNIYTIGNFSSQVDFDPGAGVYNLTGYPSGIFVQKLKSCIDVTIDVITSCYPYTWIDGNTYTVSTDTASYILTNMYGCDSIVKLDFTFVGIPDLGLSLDGSTIIANYIDATGYKWLNCDDNYNIIPFNTTYDFTPSSNGNYAVEFTDNGCVDTSACITVNTIGIVESTFTKDLIVYPNPTQGEVKIDFGKTQSLVNVKIISVLGQEVMNKVFSEISTLNIELNLPKGIYLLELVNEDKERAIIQVVKE